MGIQLSYQDNTHLPAFAAAFAATQSCPVASAVVAAYEKAGFASLRAALAAAVSHSFTAADHVPNVAAFIAAPQPTDGATL